MKLRKSRFKSLTLEEIKRRIYSEPKPIEWRNGQFVFNRIEQLYGDVARQVQHEDCIDCFYDDSAIEEFIKCAHARYHL